MKPARFHYYDPETLNEVISLLGQFGEEGKILAGGQSLVPMMNFRLARPQHLIDINKVSSLDYIRQDNNKLIIGALTRQRTVEKSDLVRKRNPLLVDASCYIGHPATRNRGTVCGSLAHADPASEWPALALLLDATLVLEGPQGKRLISASDFFVGYFTTSLEPEELLTEVQVPVMPQRAGWSFLELSRRYGDFAIVGVGIWLTADEKGTCTDGAIALTGVGPCPVRARAAELQLRGQKFSEALFKHVASAVTEDLEPDSDLHASADYRRTVAGVLTRRGLAMAQSRLGEGETRNDHLSRRT